MNLRWLLFDYADPALPLSFWKRQRIVWRFIPIWKMPKQLKRGRIICGFLIAVPLLSILIFIPYLIKLLVNMPSWGAFLLTILLFLAVCWVWSCIVYGLTSRQEHYYRIRQEGYDVCLGCGYWLRGLDGSIKACPECGTQREAILNSEEVNK